MSEQGYGGFWIRFLALLVDSLIITIVLIGLVFLVASFGGPAATTAVSVLASVGPFLYFVVMHASERQATWGKALLGMVVTNADGERISFLRSLARELGKILSTIPLLLGYVVAGFTKQKQALHDVVASTTVVRHSSGRVGLGLLIGVGGWLAPVAIVFVLGAGMFTAMASQLGGGALKSALGGITADSTESGDTTVVQASTNITPAPSAGGAEAAFAAKLTGIEEKPGMTRAGPVLLELSTTFNESFWIKTYLPPLKEFEGADPVLSLSQVTDSKGGQLYDPTHQLETPFFQKVSLSSRTSPVPHLTGTRSVNLKSGASTRDMQRVEGKVTLSVASGAGRVEREFPFVLTRGAAAPAAAPAAPAVASNSRAAAPPPVVLPAAPTAASTEAPRRPPPRPRPEATVVPLDPETVAALDQLSPRFSTEVALIPAQFRDRTVQLYDFGAIPRGAAAERVFWPIHGFDARGNPVAIRGQRPVFSTIPRLGAYSGVWQLVYVVTADMAQPNALRDAAAIDAAVRAKRAMLRDANLVLNLPIVPRGTTLARDTTRPSLGWYKGNEVQFFDFGADTLASAPVLGFAAVRDSAGRAIVVAGDSATEARNLQFAAGDGLPASRVPSPLRAFSDMRAPSPPRPTRSP